MKKIENPNINAVILAGGLGTRLDPLLKGKPKCLAPINNKPFIDILIDNCIKQGIRRFIICVGHLKEQVIKHFGVRSDCEIVFSQESDLLGTGGALKKAQSLIKSDLYIVFNGDSFIDININKYIKWSHMNKNYLSMVITKKFFFSRYGSVVYDNKGYITSFEEKNNKSKSNSINAGIYLFKKDLINFSKYKNNFSLETEVFPTLIKQGLKVFQCQGRFIDIGTEESYQSAQLFFKK